MKMKTKVIYVTGPSGTDRLFYKISERLKDYKDIESYFIATTRWNFIYLNQKITEKQLFLIDYKKENPIQKPDLRYLQEKEKEYSFNIWDFWETTAIRKKSRDNINQKVILSWFEYTIKTTEEIFEKVKPDYILTYGLAGFQSLLIYLIAKKNGIKTINLSSIPISNRFSFCESFEYSWPLIEQEYKAMIKAGIDEENENRSINFIRQYQNSPYRPDCITKIRKSLSQKVESYFKHLKLIIESRQFPEYIYEHFLLWPLRERFYKKIGIFEKPSKGEKYVLFPLHFQPEVMVSLYGKWYVDQAGLIENISKSLPLNYKLYVKEHPFRCGNRTLAFYKRIKRLPNVRLIHPQQNNFNIIKNSSLITTITGTSGWEGLLFQKKVITFGDIYYNLCPGVIKVDKIKELPLIINRSLDKTIPLSEVVTFVGAMFAGSFPGLVRLPGDCADYSLKDENIILLADGIKRYIEA